MSTHKSRAALQLTDSILIRFPELNTEQNSPSHPVYTLQDPEAGKLLAWEWQRGHNVKGFLVSGVYHQAKHPSSIQSCVGGTK